MAQFVQVFPSEMIPVPTVGNVWSMINVAHVELPARSLITNTYVPSVHVLYPLAMLVPFNVAHERFVSLKVIVTFVL